MADLDKGLAQQSIGHKVPQRTSHLLLGRDGTLTDAPGCSGLLIFNTCDTVLQDFLGSGIVRDSETVSGIR